MKQKDRPRLTMTEAIRYANEAIGLRRGLTVTYNHSIVKCEEGQENNRYDMVLTDAQLFMIAVLDDEVVRRRGERTTKWTTKQGFDVYG